MKKVPPARDMTLFTVVVDPDKITRLKFSESAVCQATRLWPDFLA